MLLRRILTAAVGIPITVYVIHYGNWLFAVTIILLALLAWREYGNMLLQKNIDIGRFGGAIVILVLLLSGWCGNSEEIILAIWIALLWTLLRTLRIWKGGNQSFIPAAFSLYGIIYIGFSFMHLILLRDLSSPTDLPGGFLSMGLGTVYIWVAFLATWASDTFAYFVGSAFGRHKLAPEISPNKSIEGFVGGLIGAVVAVLIFGHFTAIPIIHRIAAGIIVGLLGPVGDLAESALKRFCQVKDSGSLLPGHGGVLDRFDSILFSVPAMYYYVRLIILQ